MGSMPTLAGDVRLAESHSSSDGVPGMKAFINVQLLSISVPACRKYLRGCGTTCVPY